MASADAEAIAKLVGIYDFEHAGGAFDVHLRPQGKFFAPKFQARAFWTCTEAGELFIEWGKYGQYKLELADAASRAFAGSAVGKPESWRKVMTTPNRTLEEKALRRATAERPPFLARLLR